MNTGPYNNVSSDSIDIVRNRVVCPNFGHPPLTSSFTKLKISQVKNSLAIVNDLSVLKSVQLSNGNLSFHRLPTAFSKCVNLE